MSIKTLLNSQSSGKDFDIGLLRPIMRDKILFTFPSSKGVGKLTAEESILPAVDTPIPGNLVQL